MDRFEERTHEATEFVDVTNRVREIIFLCEFDGPRTRQILVQVLGDR
jgi:hypothetical protein